MPRYLVQRTFPEGLASVRPRHTSIAACLAGLALLAGCGGSSGSAAPSFSTSVESNLVKLKDTAVAIATALQDASSQTDAEVHTTFAGLSARWESDVADLHRLKPPADLSADFSTLSGAASRVDYDLLTLVSAATSHDKTAAEHGAAGLATDLVAVKTAAQTLETASTATTAKGA